MEDVIIIGGGAAGLGAALYCARFTLKTTVLAKEYGGTGNIAHLVDNWIGEPGIAGSDLMQRFLSHVKEYKVPLIEAEVTSIEKTAKGFAVQTKEKKKYESKTILFANGMTHRKLGVPGEKEFSGKGVHYCYTCLVPGAEIITNPDVKDIQLLNDEKVLTHEGRYSQFLEKVEVPYSGEVLSIIPRYFYGETKVTPQHRVLAVKKTWKYSKSLTERLKLIPDWIEASDLKKGDYVAYPILKGIKDIFYLDLHRYLPEKLIDGDFIKEQNWSPTAKKLPKQVELSGGLLRLFGYYIAEGNLGHNGIDFSFNNKEEVYVKDIQFLLLQIFGLEGKVTREGKVLGIYCYSRVLRDLFKTLFGEYAHAKKIPQEFMFLPKDKQMELVKGMWRGDGCLREKDFCYVTSSKKLAYQLKLILLRFGIIPRFEIRLKEKLKSSYIHNREIKFNHDKYHIYISGAYLEKGEKILGIPHPRTKSRNRIMNYGWTDQNYAYLPIRKIQSSYYSGKVYDLTVENAHSYTTSNLCVHNCDGPLYRGKTVAIIGGGDAAALGTLFMNGYAKKIYVIYRGGKLRAEPISAQKVYKMKKAEVIHNTNIVEIYGEKFVKGIKTDTKKDIKVDAVFIEIGHLPLNDLAKNIGVKLDEKGFISVDKNHATNIPGVFAAGDITNATSLKQFITSAAEGSIAAQGVYSYLQK